FSDSSFLLEELIMQRLCRDLQIVPAFALTQNSKRTVSQVESGKRFILSMGHRINEIYVNEEEELLEVTQYLAKYANNNREGGNTQTYRYKVFNKAQRKFIVNKQEFSRFARDYPWNPVDNVICGASDVTLTEEMRYRRVLFAIIPQYQSSAEPGSDLKAMADEYTENFKKLIDYLSNRSGDGDKIEIKYRNDEDTENQTEPASQEKIQRGLQWERETNKIVLALDEKKKKGQDTTSVRNEWCVLTMNKSFNPNRVFRISIQWLCASAPRIESEVKTLNRRCGQGKTALFYVDNRMQSEQAKTKGAEFQAFMARVDMLRDQYVKDKAAGLWKDHPVGAVAGGGVGGAVGAANIISRQESGGGQQWTMPTLATRPVSIPRKTYN
ncbi:hypothetical protein TeGR_g6852, partial [Tetraparma gracilis]